MVTDEDIAFAKAEAQRVPGYMSHDLVGSAYTYQQESANDVDILVWVADMEKAAEWVGDNGYRAMAGRTDYQELETTRPVKKGKVNLLMSTDIAWINRFRAAAEVCRYLQIPDRQVRIIIHKIVRDGARSDQYREPK